MHESRLPLEFVDLETYVESWALETEEKRFEKRISSPLEDVRAFNDAMFARMARTRCWTLP